MEEIAQIPLSRLAALGDGKIFQQDGQAVLFMSPAESGAVAAFDLPAVNLPSRFLRVRVAVESGKLEVAWFEGSEAVSVGHAIDRTQAGSTEIQLEVRQGSGSGKLVFNNAAGGNRPTVAMVTGIDVVANLREEIRAAFASQQWFNLPTVGPMLEKVEALIGLFGSPEEIFALLPQNPAIRNMAKNIWEYAKGETVLTTYPWNVTIPVADVCNARCTFCTSWLDGRKILNLDELGRFEPVLRHAILIGLVGHGEPLAHPQFGELCDRLAAMRNPASGVYTITNGFFLDKWSDQLDRINLGSVSISLNAATAETHDAVMGLGTDAFPRIVDTVRQIVEERKRSGKHRDVNITLVVTQQNLHEIPAFVELGNRLDVSSIWLRVLLPQPGLIPGLNYHQVPPYLHPDFERLRRSAVAAIRASEVPVEAEPGIWGQRIFSETLEQEIRLRPPRMISREEALRDRDLRRRNEFLYKQEHGIFRGRALPSGANSRVLWAGGRLEVTTPKAFGAYAAAVPINYPSDGAGELRVEVEAECTEGILRLGLLDEAKNTWLDRVSVDPGADGPALLKTSASGQKIQLVIHNGGRDLQARGSIGAVRVNLEGIGQLLPLEWGGLIVHNAADLFDDGTNPLNREPRFACKAVYYNLYMNEFFYRVSPCCYLQQVPGFEEVRLDGDMTFMEGWNSPGMVELRRRLVGGPLFGACMRCPEKW